MTDPGTLTQPRDTSKFNVAKCLVNEGEPCSF